MTGLDLSQALAGQPSAPVGLAPALAGHPCPVCAVGILSASRSQWRFACQQCGYLCSNLAPSIEDETARDAIDEGHRENALDGLRHRNFERELDRLAASQAPRNGRLLEVGCAHGWFLDLAARRGYEVFGLEPDPAIRAFAQNRGFQVWPGFFPRDIPKADLFDVIVFNDVFEHLPDIEGAMAACATRLRPGGGLVLNLPSSTGIFYRLAVLLERFGIPGPMERLWQEGFASPHLSYFTPRQLVTLAARHGLREVHRSTLRTIDDLTGLWSRLRYDKKSSVVASAAIYLGLVFGLPLLRLLPADISLQIFVKDSSG